MTIKLRATFAPEQFGIELEALLETWRSEWDSEDSGPSSLKTTEDYAIAAPHRWFEEMMQREAYRNLVEYVAVTLTVSNQFEEAERVLKVIKHHFQNVIPDTEGQKLYIRFLHDVFSTTLNTVRKQVNIGQDRNVDGLVAGQRDRMLQALTFGYVEKGKSAPIRENEVVAASTPIDDEAQGVSEKTLDAPKETKKANVHFIDFLKTGGHLDKEITPEAAIALLSEFHGAPKNVLDAFRSLGSTITVAVIFKETVNSGHPCIGIEGKDKDGNRLFCNLINLFTGQPQAHCG